MDTRNSLVDSAINLQVVRTRLQRIAQGISSPKLRKSCGRDLEEISESLDELIGCIMDVYFSIYCAEES